jgi:serine phosphatase RsbU (regulator of sigma subunit)
VIQAAGTEEEKKMQELFKNRIVLIGQTATGTTDISHTPFATTDPGMVVQASALHTLLSGRYLKKAGEAIHFFILFFLSLLTAEVVKRRSPLQGLLLVLAGILIYAVFNHLLFIGFGWIVPLFAPLSAMAATYAVMLFLRYMEIRFKGELISRELRTASRIQETFLPQTKPEVAGLDAAFECHFAEQVGGDLYDWSDLGSGQLGVCVGDVSGKGIPAALYMAKVLSDFRRENKNGKMPAEVCEAMNRLLIHESNSGMFLTLLYALVDVNKKTISFSSAGHEPIIFYQHNTQSASVMKGGQGRPLGLFEDSAYGTADIPFQTGDAFLLLSDGVKELRSAQGEELGLNRLADFFAKEVAAPQSAEAIIKNLFKAMQDYQRGGMPPHDDRTLVCVKAI